MTIACGTGHRPEKLGGHGVEVAARLVKLAGEIIEERKPDVVISGMALGWDQALAVACMQMGVEWWAFVPFAGQEAVWPAKAKALYKELVGRAHHVRYVSEPGYAPWKMQARNVAMVDCSDEVLALWDGHQDGGTWNCVQYAMKKQRPIHNSWSKWRLSV